MKNVWSKWEFKVVTLSAHKDNEPVEELLNEWGELGWDIVDIWRYMHTNAVKVILKRVKVNE